MTASDPSPEARGKIIMGFTQDGEHMASAFIPPLPWQEGGNVDDALDVHGLPDPEFVHREFDLRAIVFKRSLFGATRPTITREYTKLNQTLADRTGYALEDEKIIHDLGAKATVHADNQEAK